MVEDLGASLRGNISVCFYHILCAVWLLDLYSENGGGVLEDVS